MNEAFDPLNIFILLVAVIVLLRLRSVLGRRTGHEGKPFDPYGSQDAAKPKPDTKSADDNVVPLPGRDDGALANNPYRMREEEEQPVWKDIAEEGTPLAKTLEKIRGKDKSFDPNAFLQGARVAYEMIVSSFADGDRKTLKRLLSREVYNGFESALSDREKAGHAHDSTFVGIDKSAIIDAALSGRKASMTVKFVSQLISATHDKSGKLIEGDPNKVREVTDIWTFMRDVTSNEPDWKLVATEAAN